jgi:hypothetical protein
LYEGYGSEMVRLYSEGNDGSDRSSHSSDINNVIVDNYNCVYWLKLNLDRNMYFDGADIFYKYPIKGLNEKTQEIQ